MWTCRNCSAQSEDAPEVCPSCGTVDLEITASDEPPPSMSEVFDEEGPTEYDVHPLPDPGSAVVECYIGVNESDASAVASKLRDLGIPVYLARDNSGTSKTIHRVRVPFVDLGRALAVIDLLQQRRRPDRH